MRRMFAVAILCLAMPMSAMAVVRDVTSIADLRNALGAALPGDEIRIHYGVYQVRSSDDHKRWFKRSGTVANPIRIVGLDGPNGERPVFDATGTPIERGIFYIWDYTSNYVIENLEFRNARGQNYWPNNAAAAYIGGDNITFRNCYSHHNDNGWFATSAAENTLLEYCETAYNGKIGSGDMTHNHYMGAQSLTVRGCYIHNSTEGQNFKSRCGSVRFEYNWVENAANYDWELASNNAGNTVMIGNVIIKSPNSTNNRIIGLSDGTSSDPTRGTLTMINNTIVTTSTSHRCFFEAPVGSTNVVLYNNAFIGPSTRIFDSSYWMGSGTISGSHNWFRGGTSVPAGVTGSLFGYDPMVVDLAGQDYRPLTSSPLRNAGLAAPAYLTPSYIWQVLVPDAEYVALAGTRIRLVDATLDIGAFEGPIYDGDANNDGIVNVIDLLMVANSFNSAAGLPNYDPRCDFNGDGWINGIDLLTLARDFGK